MVLQRSPPASPGQSWEDALGHLGPSWPGTWAALFVPAAPACPLLSSLHTHLMMPSHPSSPSQNNTLLVEGCFCPEGTMNYAPGFDVCVKSCGMPPTHGLLSCLCEAELGPAAPGRC